LWGDPAKLVEALSVLLLIWNGAFYRYGNFDEAALEINLRDNQTALNAFRERDIAFMRRRCDVNRSFWFWPSIVCLRFLAERLSANERGFSQGRAKRAEGKP